MPLDPVIAAVGLFSLAGFDLAAAVVVAAAGSAVVGLAVAVDSAAPVFAVADPGFVVAADLVCCLGSVCSFVGTTMEKGRVVVAIFCSLTPRSSF